MSNFIIEGNCVFETGVRSAQLVIDKTSKKILKIDYSCKNKSDRFFEEDCLIFPGMGDIHVHARQDVTKEYEYKEDFYSASLAAVNGGVTFICDMPNNKKAPTTEEKFKEKCELVKNSKAIIPIVLYAAIGPGTVPFDKNVLYKVYMSHSIGGISFNDYDSLEKTLKNYRGCKVSFHCEDPEILEKNKLNTSFYDTRPPEAEIVAIQNAIKLISMYEIKGTICHVSTMEGAKCIIEAKGRGVNVKFEVTPQHLYFSRELIDESGRDHLKFRMNPPIRYRQDQEYLLNLFRKGLVDYLATDHAPHTVEEKNRGISGLTGLDTFGPFCTWLISKSVNPLVILKSCCTNPAIHIQKNGFGRLEEGCRATLTVLKLNEKVVIDSSYLKTKSLQTVWEQVNFPGSVETISI